MVLKLGKGEENA